MTEFTPAILLERARALADEIRGRAREIDGASKLPDDIVRKFVDLELVSLLVPRRFGGHEARLNTAIEIIKIIGEADLSTAWVLAFYVGHNWIHCQFPEEGQREIFANGPSPCSAGVLSPQLKLKMCEGGYTVSGRSAWNSGSPHADWIMGAGMAFDGDKPAGPRIVIVPQSEVEVIDTWDVQAMRSTGSWDVAYNEVFVPAHRTVDVVGMMNGDTPGAKLHANNFYSRPLTPVVFAYCLAPIVGALRGAVDQFAKITAVRVGTNDGKVVKEKPSAHIRMGRAETNAYLAALTLGDMVAFLESPESAQMSVQQRVALKARSAQVVQMCKDTIGDLIVGAGANAFRSESPLQTVFRNISMISLHAFFDNDATMEAFGRSLLGLEPNTAV